MLLIGQIHGYIEFYNVGPCGSSLRNCIVKDYTPCNLLSLTVLYFTFTFIHFLSLLKHFGRSPLLHSCIDHHSPFSGKHSQYRHNFWSLFTMSNFRPFILFACTTLWAIAPLMISYPKYLNTPKALPPLLSLETYFVLHAAALRSCAQIRKQVALWYMNKPHVIPLVSPRIWTAGILKRVAIIFIRRIEP